MTSAEPMKRSPAETRRQLLDVAADRIRAMGLQGITLDAVAKESGISKGGLLHHFPSKRHLIDAVIVDVHERFRERMREIAAADPVETGRMTRAYLKVATENRDEQAKKLCSILAVEARDNPTMRIQWKECITSLLSGQDSGDADPILLAVVQMATDGLWLAQTEGVFDDVPQLCQQIIERLEQLTYQTAVKQP